MKKNISSILFICMGNICRSPAAHGVLEQINQERKLNWQIDSCGTTIFHQGSPPDRRMQKVLQAHGIQFQHRSQGFRVAMAYEFDLLLAMDFANYTDVQGLLQYEPELLDKLSLFRDFDPELAHGQRMEVPDPYYNGKQSFEEVYEMIVRTCSNIAKYFS